MFVRRVQYDSRFFSVVFSRFEKGVDLSVETRPMIPVGTFIETLVFETDDETSANKTVMISGEAFSRIEAVPSFASLGAFSKDTPPKPVRVTLRSRTGDMFRITGYQLDNDNLGISIIDSIPPPAVVIWPKHFASPGTISASVRIATDNVKMPDVLIHIYGILKPSDDGTDKTASK